MIGSLSLYVVDSPGSSGVGDALEFPAAGAAMGRSADCEHCLADPFVSREHARVFSREGVWFITDCDSTGGTLLNAARLVGGEAARLRIGDEIEIGPWRLRVGEPGPINARTIAVRSDGQRGATLHKPTRRLRALSSCIERLVGAAGEEALARAALESAIEGSGFRRGAVLRPPTTGGVAQLAVALERVGSAWRELGEDAIGVPSSLAAAAVGGQTAVIDDQADLSNVGESIVSRSIHSAVCCPVKLDGRVTLLIYLDSRAAEGTVDDATSFCEDVAQVYALALAYWGRVELEREQAALHAELRRADELRAMLEPERLVRHGEILVAHRMWAGHVVAGDLVDIHTLDDGSVVVLIGDATGHGVGAALLSSLVQAHLHAEISREGDVLRAVQRTNNYIGGRPRDGSFVSLWAGRVYPDGRYEFVDAGHGHWAVVRGDGAIEPVDRAGGLPLGIEAGTHYELSTGRLARGDRIVLYTDGVVEQRIGDAPFGLGGVARILGEAKGPQEDVAGVVRALGGVSLVDDATIVSIAFGQSDGDSQGTEG